MEMTTLWLVWASHGNTALRNRVEAALRNGEPSEMTIEEMYRLRFVPEEQYVYVFPYSEESKYSRRIIPARFSYRAVENLMHGNMDDLMDDDIQWLPQSTS